MLAGERLIGQVDLKARRGQGRLDVLSTRFESTKLTDRDRRALERFSASVALPLGGPARIA